MDKALDSIIQVPALTSTWASTPTLTPIIIKASTELKTNGEIKTPIKDHGETKTRTTMAHGAIKTQIKAGETKTKALTIPNQTPTGAKIKLKDGVIKILTKAGATKTKDLTTTQTELQAGVTQHSVAVHGAQQTHTTGITHSA